MCPIPSIQDFFEHSGKEALDRVRYLVVLLLNPSYLTDAGKIVFDNLPYLDLRTRNVHFFIPGFEETNYNLLNDRQYNRKSTLSSNVRNITSDNFNFKGFAMSIAWLEHTLSGYFYNEGSSLCIIDTQALMKGNQNFDSSIIDGSVGRDDYVAFDLDALCSEGNNLIRLFSEITMKLEYESVSFHELRYLTDRSSLRIRRGLPIFIAGSKTLVHQRNSVKAELLSLQNRLDYPLRIYTFEDFDDSFTEGGRQEQYNFFIRHKARYIIFILDSKVGGITFEEFKVAVDSFRQRGHPKIYVYSKKVENLDEENKTMELDSIRNYCTDLCQYFTEYLYDEQLSLLVYRSFSNCLFFD